MWPFRSEKTSPVAYRAFLALVAAILTVKAWFIVTTPLRGLVMSPWLLDDSFITMQVAKNVGLAGLFSFDGVHLTTGVAPLWTYMIALPIMAFPKEMAVPAVMLLSTAFGGACSYAVYRITTNLSDDRWTPVAAGLLTALMPAEFFNAMNGMETGFFSLMILLALGGAAGALRFARPAWANGALTGLFLGLAILTRADAVFAIAAIGAWKAWEWWTQTKHRRDVAIGTMNIAAVVAVCLMVFLAWQAHQTGSFFPDNQVGRRAIALEDHGFDFARFALAPYLKISLWNVFQLESLWTLATGSTVLALVAMGWAWTREHTRPMAAVAIMYAGLFVTVLCLYQWYFPDFHGLRYINASTHLAIMFTTLAMAELFKGYWRQTALCLFGVILVTLSWYRYFDMIRDYPAFKDMGLFGQANVETQDQFWAAIDWVKDNVPDDATIALRDHGRMAFFTDRKIQDLAGILDGDVLVHRDDGTLGAYLLERGAAYVFLPDPVPGNVSIYQKVHDALRLQRIVGAPNQEITGYKPYKVLGVKR